MNKKDALEKIKELLKMAQENPEQFRELTKTVPTEVKASRRSAASKERSLRPHVAPSNSNKGVHPSRGPRRQKAGSWMGHHVDMGNKEAAKASATKVLADIKAMPKPNLPKSEWKETPVKSIIPEYAAAAQAKREAHLKTPKGEAERKAFNEKAKAGLKKDWASFENSVASAGAKFKQAVGSGPAATQQPIADQKFLNTPTNSATPPAPVRKSEQEPNLIVDKEIRMDQKEMLEMAKQLLKAAKENPAEFDQALKKAMAAPAPAAPKAPAMKAPKLAAPKAPAMKAPAAMSKEEKSAMIKEELKADFKPRFGKK